MDRINVYEQIDYDTEWMRRDEKPALLGWFDLDKAERFIEDTEWNGNNHISVMTGSQWDHEALLRTKQGRWVLHTYSNRQGVMDTFRFLSDSEAQQWLIRNNDDAVVARFFGELEEERGPGRPAIGEPINIRIGEELLGHVDAYASENGISSRAEAVRVLLAEALTAVRP